MIPALNDVVTIHAFQRVEVKEQSVIMVKDPITVEAKQTGKIGSPQDVKTVLKNRESMNLSQVHSFARASQLVEPVMSRDEKDIAEIVAPVQGMDDDEYMPIKALNTFNSDWIIKARVTSRPPVRDTAKGMKLLKLELTDSQGTVIEAAMFGDTATHFDELIKKDRVYSFSKGKVTIANKKFSTVKNDFALTLYKNS